MALTREQVQAYIALSERATGGEWYFTEDERTWQMFAEFGGMYAPHQIIKAPKKSKEYAEYWPNQVTSEFIAQSRNIGPQLAHGYLQKDAEIQQKDAQIQRMREALERMKSLVSSHDDYFLDGINHDILNEIRQALADIDAGSGADVEEGEG